MKILTFQHKDVLNELAEKCNMIIITKKFSGK